MEEGEKFPFLLLLLQLLAPPHLFQWQHGALFNAHVHRMTKKEG